MTEEFIKTQQAKDKHYPEANEWMWDYCLFLGKFTNSEGINYDLGIHVSGTSLSAAIVDGPEPWEYNSAIYDKYRVTRLDPHAVYDEIHIETVKRARERGYKI